MPLRFWLCVVYSATFLYKARCTGVMNSEETSSVKRMISDVVDKLQKASSCANDIGDRYSRLLRLLWRKPPSRAETTRADAARGPLPPHMDGMGPQAAQGNAYGAPINPPSINAFSWLDLSAVGDFATNNNSIPSGSLDGLNDRFEEGSADGFSNFDSTFAMPAQYGWNNTSSYGVMF